MKCRFLEIVDEVLKFFKLILFILFFLNLGLIFLLLNFKIKDDVDGIEFIQILIKLNIILGFIFLGSLNLSGWNLSRIDLEGIVRMILVFIGLK